MRWISEDNWNREHVAKQRVQLACEQLRRYCRVKLKESADMNTIIAIIKQKFDIDHDRAIWLISNPAWHDRPTAWMRKIPVELQIHWNAMTIDARLTALYMALLASEGEI